MFLPNSVLITLFTFKIQQYILRVNNTLTRKTYMKEVIIYGGAFNPPTKAHQQILQACVEYAEPRQSEVWVMPSGERRDKAIAVPLERRIKLAQALCRSVDGGVRMRVEPIELQQKQPTETFQSQMLLQAKYPEAQFRWVFGSDSVQTMLQWDRGDWLYKNLGMLIVMRPGYALDELPPRGEVLSVEPLDVSSSQVRARLAEGRDVSAMVPERVLAQL